MPNWVPIACYAAIGIGTMSGGWKIVKTMGTKITKVTPFEGVAAETAGAITLFVTEALKIPVSTTHTITGAIMGVGATKRLICRKMGCNDQPDLGLGTYHSGQRCYWQPVFILLSILFCINYISLFSF